MFFFFNDTATTEIYTLSLHDALPISLDLCPGLGRRQCQFIASCLGLRPPLSPAASGAAGGAGCCAAVSSGGDRKSTRLNSSHANISYAVFCLKKKIGRAHVCTPVTQI